jgi:hypothetical protein
MIVRLTWDLILWCGLLLQPHESLEAEILFLRRQLALYRERERSRGGWMRQLEWRWCCCRAVSIGVALLWLCGRRR